MREFKLIKVDKVAVDDKYKRSSSADLSSENVLLSKSMKAIGLRFPITVKENGNGYHLVDGVRRLDAAKRLHWNEIPAFVVPSSDKRDLDNLRYQLNAQRENLKPMDEARLIKSLVEDEGLSLKEAAKFFGKRMSTLQRYFDLLRAVPKWQRLVNEGRASMHNIQSVVAYTKKGQQKIYKEIKRRGLPFSEDVIRGVCRSFDPVKDSDLFNKPKTVASMRKNESFGHPFEMKRVQSIAKMRVITDHRQKVLKRYEDEIAAAIPVIKKIKANAAVWDELPVRSKHSFEDFLSEY